MTSQKAFTVRLSPEHAELLAQRARLAGESEPAFIRSLVVAELGREPDAGSDADSIGDQISTLTHYVNGVAHRLEDLIAEFVTLSRWLVNQTSDLPEADSDVGPAEGLRTGAE